MASREKTRTTAQIMLLVAIFCLVLGARDLYHGDGWRGAVNIGMALISAGLSLSPERLFRPIASFSQLLDACEDESPLAGLFGFVGTVLLIFGWLGQWLG